MNTHDIELPPLPKGDIAADTCPVMWVHSNEQLQAYTLAAIEPYAKHIAELEEKVEADRKRGGESSWIVGAVDAAMLEMKNIHPPLKRSECERLIRAAFSTPQPAAPVFYVNPKIVDPDTGKIARHVTNAITWSDEPVAGAWTMPVYAAPQPAELYAALQSQDREDAERYRAWRRAVAAQNGNFLRLVSNELPDWDEGPVDESRIDAAIDYARRIEGKT